MNELLADMTLYEKPLDVNVSPLKNIQQISNIN
jgi:hypothetical protein